MTTIEDSAFIDCVNLSEVRCFAITPPITGETVFGTADANALLYVPKGTKELYASAEDWNGFKEIIDNLDPVASIDNVLPNEQQISVHSINGTSLGVMSRERLNTLPVGIYIVNGKKVFVR